MSTAFSMQVSTCEKKWRKKTGREKTEIDKERKKCGTGWVCLRFLLDGCQRQNELQQKIIFSQFVDSWHTVNFTEFHFAKQQALCSVIKREWVFKILSIKPEASNNILGSCCPIPMWVSIHSKGRYFI